MSLSEQGRHRPDDPQRIHTPFRLRERAAKPGQTNSLGARSSEPIGSSPIASPAPKVISELARRTRDLDRRTALLSVAARVAAVVGVAAVVVLLFVITKPASLQSVASSNSAEIAGSTSTAPPRSDVSLEGSKPALAEFQGFLASPPSQPAAPPQTQQVLRQFLQWRNKVDTTETSQ